MKAKTPKVDHAHKHDHCKHANLKFCVQCNRPHCLDCGTEWNQYTTYFQPTYTYLGGTMAGQSTATLLTNAQASGAGSINAQNNASSVTATSTCLHN